MNVRFRTIYIVLVVAVCLAIAAPVARADSYSVYVGYADSLRPSGFFPSPFSVGTVYSGQDPSIFALDSGAVRIDNTDTIPITISNLTVTLNGGSGPTFALWGSVTLNPGQIGVFAQTAQYNFDSSDSGFLPNGIGIDGSHPLGGCTNPGALSSAQQAACVNDAPTVSFSENANSVNLTDSGNIIDTFGYDFVCCSSDGNESINWNLIGSSASRSGVPEPGYIALIGVGLPAVMFYGRRRRAQVK